MCSAQLANIFCLIKEHKFFTDRTPWLPSSAVDGHMDLTMPPPGYADNILGVHHGRTPLKTIQKFFEKLLGIQLQIEGEGTQWTSLNATLSFSQATSQISVAMKHKLSVNEPPNKRVVRCRFGLLCKYCVSLLLFARFVLRNFEVLCSYNVWGNVCCSC